MHQIQFVGFTLERPCEANIRIRPISRNRYSKWNKVTKVMLTDDRVVSIVQYAVDNCRFIRFISYKNVCFFGFFA
jgi:hypothetical protein